ncbi:MAG TPA: patatin-like phospholipase family protein [Thermoanaerobaculia bacterium]
MSSASSSHPGGLESGKAASLADTASPCSFECDEPRPFQDPSLGLVLTGGGAFGAWEAGALESLFDYWNQKYGTDPPIRLVVGTSTGALIAPFAALGRTAVHYVADWYHKVTTKDIYRLSPLHLLRFQSIYDWGFPDERCAPRSGLYRKYAEVLRGLKLPGGRDALEAVARAWASSTDRKIVAASLIDFSTGATDYVMNSPEDLPPVGPDELRYCSRFYDGVFASAVPPLLGSPTPLLNRAATFKTPHFDGGPYQEAPFDVFFEIQSEQRVRLTHVILISSYPFFPGSDGKPAQATRFPADPNVLEIGGRFDSVLSEAAVTNLTRLACQTLGLQAKGHDPEHIRKHTGMRPPHCRDGEIPQLVTAFPHERMGFDPDRFNETEMGEMRRRGQTQALPLFQRYFP